METLDDRHQIFNPYQAPCLKCRQDFDSITLTCKAFPGGIPDQILEGKDMHELPIPEQENSIVFSLR